MTWKSRFQKLFPPDIQRRGESYFRRHAVGLDKATESEISSIITGSQDYSVEIIDESKSGISAQALCECPHFKRGYPCKHLWATILAADAYLAKEKTVIDNVAQSKPSTPWRSLLFPGQIDKPISRNRWEGVPGEFMLRYELALTRTKITFSALKHKVLKDGGLGRQVQPASHDILNEHDLPRADRSVLEILLSLYYRSMYDGNHWSRGYSTRKFDSYNLDPVSMKMLLPDIAATGRCVVLLDGQKIADPLRLGDPFEGKLEFTLDPDSQGNRKKYLVYEPQVHIGDSIVPCAQIPIFLNTDPLFFIFKELLQSLPGPSLEWVKQIRSHKHKVKVPKTEIKELFQAVDSTDTPTDLVVPKELEPKAVLGIEPQPCLEIEFTNDEHVARLWLDYDGSEILFDDARSAILDIEKWTRTERHPEIEKTFFKRITQLGFDSHGAGFTLPQASSWQVLNSLGPLVEDGWTIRSRDKRKLHAGKISGMRVTSGLDWFDLEGSVAFGDVIVPLPTAMRAFLRGEQTLALPNGETGILPQEWLAANAPALSMADTTRAKDLSLRFHSAHALLLDTLLAESGAVSVDNGFAEKIRRMKNFSSVTHFAPPSEFQGVLRPYQLESLGWLDFLKSFGFGGILADDMGLGKTVQVLSWIALEKERGESGPSLVVAPTSLLFNWRDEAARFTPDIRVLTYAGLDRSIHIDSIEKHDLILTTYGLLRRDVAILRKVPWRWLILDESQAIKNPDSQTAKAAQVVTAKHRLCMTGTPLENKLDELWSQLHFLNPNMLGSRTGFDNRFSKPIGQGDEATKNLLLRVIKPFVLRRTKEMVAADLPEKQESIIHCEMTKPQAAVYARLRDHYRAEILSAVDESGLNRSKMKVLEGLLRLRQVACHPGLVGEEAAGSGKLEELIRLIHEVVEEGHKALIFSQFTKFLAIIRKRLESEGIAYEYLDGRTPPKARESRVAAFQDPSGPPVFCISLKAGGVGLNLTAADYVFIMDPWWNPAVENQAVDRTHRIGQDKKVFAYRLISGSTIDEKVLNLQQDKRELAEMLEEGATSIISSLTRENLELLLS